MLIDFPYVCCLVVTLLSSCIGEVEMVLQVYRARLCLQRGGSIGWEE